METILIYVTAFAVSFVYIFLKAKQQLHVVHAEYLWMLPTSLGLALCEVLIIGSVVKESILVFLPLGIGGSIGCMLSVYLHNRNKEEK